MTREMRYKNVRGVFKVKKKYEALLNNKNVLFVDDILTTGATADECSRMLKKSGAKSVLSATLCITR